LLTIENMSRSDSADFVFDDIDQNLVFHGHPQFVSNLKSSLALVSYFYYPVALTDVIPTVQIVS